MKGNLIEIYYTLELLAQFTFNEVIKQSINESKEYDDILESLMIRTLVNEDDTQVYSSIRRVVEQIKWNLNKENRHSGASSIGSLGALSLNSTDQHIMISYNSSSRDLCLKIKRELELMEYKVWIDVNTISGSSLEAMSNAVENSFCVLICVTENYRQSINCQAEAKYAFRRKKPIIPLIMQPDYEDPKGWLGFIMSDKIFVNFSKYDFAECMKRLTNEIHSIKNKTLKNMTNNNKHDSVSDWTELRVKAWFDQNALSLLIFGHFKPFNGKILKQMYDMKSKASDFYFQSLTKIENVEFNDVLKFSASLEDLFNLN